MYMRSSQHVDVVNSWTEIPRKRIASIVKSAECIFVNPVGKTR